jgi:hypothetical protein
MSNKSRAHEKLLDFHDYSILSKTRRTDNKHRLSLKMKIHELLQSMVQMRKESELTK